MQGRHLLTPLPGLLWNKSLLTFSGTSFSPFWACWCMFAFRSGMKSFNAAFFAVFVVAMQVKRGATLGCDHLALLLGHATVQATFER
ncbi:hypothetical protein GDO78_016265 [Eleutherodactylus coqui]|uniref:Uncharacterized protein n=1 Tax=Eleutherodactylus coqui TaxID=57060 RepID=A0A8J6E6B8_ELECQ|nr:hypothetical protein GDO78_016265 [Eleutherodactylus coqui]